MTATKKLLIPLMFLFLVFTFAAPAATAKDKEFDAFVRQLQTTYQAKKVRIPFMWLARFAVKIVRPAGVKSFNFTLFENPKFSTTSLDDDMKSAAQNSLSADWSPILRIRSRQGDQVYAYMRENGKDIKLLLVTISNDNAAVIRATFNPDKLAEFINNPRIFGVSIGDDKDNAKNSKDAEKDKDSDNNTN